MMKMQNPGRKLAIAVLAVGTTLPAAFATGGTDYSSLTGAVDFTTVITAVLVVLAALAGLDVAFTGGKKILAAIRGK